jgi:hypothetical protein
MPRAYPLENVLVQVEGGQDDDMGAAEAEQEMFTAVEAAEAAHRGREAAEAEARRAREETARARRELAEESCPCPR